MATSHFLHYIRDIFISYIRVIYVYMTGDINIAGMIYEQEEKMGRMGG